jgi:hypothetical protein
LPKLLREPLLHFGLIGIALFLLFSLVRGGNASRDAIVVSAAQVDHLAAQFARRWQRPPTQPELDALIEDHLREEVLNREAIGLGLDRDDTIIRRRLRQKMEFLADQAADRAEPSDGELRDYLAQHADDYRIAERFSFHQVYLDPARHGDQLAARSARLLAELGSLSDDADLTRFGDASLLEPAYRDTSAAEVAKLFGESFAAQLAQLPLASWQGPLTSGYGSHLVRLEQRRPAEMPELDQVRAAVLADWRDSQRRQANQAYVKELLSQYQVTIERPR